MNKWDEIYSTKSWGKYPDTELVRFICREQNKISVLEIGCGTGANTEMLINECGKVFAIDNSRVAIDIINNKKLNCLTSVMDATELQYVNDSFDIVVDVQCLSHNSQRNAQKIVSEAHRVLVEGGKYYCQVFGTGCDKEYFEDKGEVNFYDKLELIELFKKFSSVQTGYILRVDKHNGVIEEHIIIAKK